MHILFLTVSYPNSYKQQSHVFFREQARALSLAGAQVGVVSAIPISILDVFKKKKIDFGLKTYSEDHVQVMVFQFPALPKLYYLTHIFRGFFNRILIRKYIDAHGKPQLIHNHVALSGEPAIWAKKKYLITYIVSEHYSTFLKKKIPAWRSRLAKKIFSGSEQNIAVSAHLAQKLQSQFNIEFKVIPNLVDVDFFKPLKKNNTLEGAHRKFISIGNLISAKNHDLLIRAFTVAFKKNEHYKLTIAGSGTNYTYLNSLIAELGMQKQIELFGQADREEVLHLLRNSDYFVLSSKYETFGIVLIEAMACGLPVISTKCGGPESIVADENIGILCEMDEKSIANSLVRITEMAFNAGYIRSYVMENYSSDTISRQLIKVYEGTNFRL